MLEKTVNIPEELWSDFINVIYAAVQHITPTEENAKIMLHLKGIVAEAFKNEEVLIVDGMIVDRKKFSDG